MHVDLVESLRCPRPHEDGWLVASADTVVERRIIRGVIGCPQCAEEWPVVDGALRMRGESAPVVEQTSTTCDSSTLAEPGQRLAAQLDLIDGRGAIVLAGEYARLADTVQQLTGVIVLAVNPPPDVADAHSRLFVDAALPLGVGSVRAIALDAAHVVGDWPTSAVRAVERGGRLVAPAKVRLPGNVTELARDGVEWVGEVRVAASGLVPLRRSGDPLAR